MGLKQWARPVEPDKSVLEESGAALRYARYGSELAHVAVGSCDDVTGCQVHRSFSCTVKQNANFAHSAFQVVPRACLQPLGHSRCFWRVAAQPDLGQKASASDDNGNLRAQKRTTWPQR